MAIIGLPKPYSRGLAASASAAGWMLVADPAPGVVAVLSLRDETDCADVDRAADSGSVVIALVSPCDRHGVAHALRHGAHPAGWDWDPEEIVAAAAAAVDGRVLLPFDVARAAVPDSSRHSSKPALSADEARWLTALAGGVTVVSLADDEGYSERAMFRRLADLYARLGARNRTEALLAAERHGLLNET